MKKVIRHQFGVKLFVLVLTVHCSLFTVHCFSQGLGININGNAANSKSLLDIDATGMSPKAGILIPRITTNERNAISAPIPESLMIYNTDSHCFEAYYNGGWVAFGCLGSGCSVPAAPTTGSHTPAQTTITWNWNIVSEATGYQWNTSSIYPGAGVNTISSPTYTQGSLICETAYTIYIWAYNLCGPSSSTTLTQSTSSCCSVNCSGSGNIGTFAGNGVGNYAGDGGSALCAAIQYPQGLLFDGSGNMYIADMGNFRVRKVNTSGTISTFAGGNLGFGGDGGPATAASLSSTLFGIALDQSGNMYICDRGNQVVRKINTAGTISTFAGYYNFSIGGYSGDGGPATAALLDQPWDVAIDGSGNVYIADKNNNRIRKVTVSTGIISTFAGNGIRTYSGDGGAATNASIAYPSGVTIDASGNVYISDNQNNRIRKVNTSGTISTFAGKGTAGYHYTGDGGAATAAEISTPGKIAIDGTGNVYIPDGGNQVVRMVNTSGTITTFAGYYPGNYGYSGDGGPATNAEFRNPYFLVIDASGNVYISDYSNNRVRKVCK